jgi:hypothetical protein
MFMVAPSQGPFWPRPSCPDIQPKSATKMEASIIRKEDAKLASKAIDLKPCICMAKRS